MEAIVSGIKRDLVTAHNLGQSQTYHSKRTKAKPTEKAALTACDG